MKFVPCLEFSAFRNFFGSGLVFRRYIFANCNGILWFDSFQLVLIGISNEFVENKDCCNLAAFARINLRKEISLVVFGSGFEWKKSDFCLQILAGDEVSTCSKNVKYSQIVLRCENPSNTYSASVSVLYYPKITCILIVFRILWIVTLCII